MNRSVIIRRNWKSIKRAMELSKTTEYSWSEYSRKISNGLSNRANTQRGCGDVLWVVERLNQYSHLCNEYLRFGVNLEEDLIKFINDNRDFLKTVK